MSKLERTFPLTAKKICNYLIFAMLHPHVNQLCLSEVVSAHAAFAMSVAQDLLLPLPVRKWARDSDWAGASRNAVRVWSSEQVFIGLGRGNKCDLNRNTWDY